MRKGHIVAEALELAQLEDRHEVTKVEVDRRRVEAGVNAQGPAAGQALAQVLAHRRLDVRVAVLDAPHEELQLLVRWDLRCHELHVSGVILSAAKNLANRESPSCLG
jgi:hypothetical protein